MCTCLVSSPLSPFYSVSYSCLIWFIPQSFYFCCIWFKFHIYVKFTVHIYKLVCPEPSSFVQHGLHSSLYPHPYQTFNLVCSNPIYCWLLYGTAWQGTDLMHNHVLADTSLSVTGVPGNLPCSDQSEDSDYDSVWTATSYRTASFSRKILVMQPTAMLVNQLAYS